MEISDFMFICLFCLVYIGRGMILIYVIFYEYKEQHGPCINNKFVTAVLLWPVIIAYLLISDLLSASKKGIKSIIKHLKC